MWPKLYSVADLANSLDLYSEPMLCDLCLELHIMKMVFRGSVILCEVYQYQVA